VAINNNIWFFFGWNSTRWLLDVGICKGIDYADRVGRCDQPTSCYTMQPRFCVSGQNFDTSGQAKVYAGLLGEFSILL